MSLTATECKAALRCLMLWRYEYGMGYRALAQSEDLRFGTLWHKALETWWTLWQAAASARLGAAMDVLVAGAADASELARAAWLLHAYHARWAADCYVVLGVEQRFAAELNGVDIAGKVDVLVLDPSSQRVLVVEHKTTSEDLGPGTDYWQRLRLDWQVSLYLAGARSLGVEPAAVLYDVARKPKLRPLLATPLEARKYTKGTKKDPSRLYVGQRETDETAEEYSERVRAEIADAPERYLARGEVVRLEEEERAAGVDLDSLARILRSSCAPRNPAGCWAYGRWCDFHAVCCGEASLGDTTRFRKVDDVHEELKEA